MATLRHSSQTADRDSEYLLVLLQPSWLSALIAIAVSLGATISIITNHFAGGSLRQLLQARSATPQGSISSSYHAVGGSLSSNTIVSDIPLIIFWGCVGLIAYFFTMNIVNVLRDVAELKAEMNFIHVDRHHLLRAAAAKLLARLAVLLVWLAFVRFTIHIVLPYFVAVVNFASGSVGLFNNVAYTCLGFIVLASCIHIHAVFLRLLALRPRLFGWISYT